MNQDPKVLVENLIMASVSNNTQAINKAGNVLLDFIKTPISIPTFVNIIKFPKNPTIYHASYLYLEKSIIFHWETFDENQILEIQNLIIELIKTQDDNICFRNCCKLIQFILKNCEKIGFPSLFAFLNEPVSSQEQALSRVHLYSGVIEFLPQDFVIDNCASIYNFALFGFNYKISENNPNENNMAEPNLNINSFSQEDIYTESFHIASKLAQITNNPQYVINHLELILNLISPNIAESNFVLIFKEIWDLSDLLIEIQEIMVYLINFAFRIVTSEEFTPYLRNYALSAMFPILNVNELPPDQVYILLIKSFEISVAIIVSEPNNIQYSPNPMIEPLKNIYPEETISKMILDIIQKEINSNDTAHIIAAIFLMIDFQRYLSDFFLQNEDFFSQILINLLSNSSHFQIQLAVLIFLQNSENPLSFSFPKVCHVLFPLIFHHDECFANQALNAFRHFFQANEVNISQSLSLHLFEIVWESRSINLENNPGNFFELIFCLTLNSFDLLNDNILQELFSYVVNFSDSFKIEFPIVLSSLKIGILFLMNNDEYNEVLIPIINNMICKVLNFDDITYYLSIFNYLYLFIHLLKYQSHEYLRSIDKLVIEKVIQYDNELCIRAGCVIIKYWNCAQIKPVIFPRLWKLIIKSKQENYDDDDDDISDDHPLFCIKFLAKYLEPQEGIMLIQTLIEFHLNNNLAASLSLYSLIKHSQEENHGNIVSILSNLILQSMKNNYSYFDQICQLFTYVFCWKSDVSYKFANDIFSPFIQIYPSVSVLTKDTIIGVFCDMITYDKILNEDRYLKLTELSVQAILNESLTIQEMHNCCFLLNIILRKHKEIIFTISEKLLELLQKLGNLFVHLEQQSVEDNNINDNLLDNVASLVLNIITLIPINVIPQCGNQIDEYLAFSVSRFPTQDKTEIVPMLTNMIGFVQNLQNNKIGLSANATLVLALAFTRFLMLGKRRRCQIKIEEETIASSVRILKLFMSNEGISNKIQEIFSNNSSSAKILKMYFNKY
ncbi:hypothetical protein TRFO_10231 [Tritrichomonas foetus]|uniref:Importin N-terminal domain-containing protein n=1 Tax=Tritrichomonas foetus TaxID=1144522 RepID=A0A1J4JA34_9EUKA|nr:hypothetical protein TRFO_10231 [Tritrichomonas foetus]|eukprot:OHS96046.1 hypothetical protein TRFO_10231 [Tritrichomonas foetus]